MEPALSAGDASNRRVIDGEPAPSDAHSIEQLRLAVEAGQLGIWDWDVIANRVAWSDRVYELHGIAPGQFGGRVEDFAAIVHPDDRARLRSQIEEALRGEVPYAAEFRVPLADGRIRWLATRARVVRDATGRPVRMVGTTYDITERATLLAAEREARAAAERAGRRLEILAMAGTVLSGSLEPQATLEEIASLLVPDMADWCRVDLLDTDGMLRRALTHHSDAAKARAAMASVTSGRATLSAPGSMSWAVETGLSHLARFDANDSYDAVRDADLREFARAIGLRAYFVVPLIARGRTLGALAVLQAESNRDFTQDDCALVAEIAHRAALALDNARLFVEADQARLHAEQASRAKDEFLAMLGHELRNPLAPIVTALHLMSMRGDTATEGERRIIERQVAHLSRLVDDLLDVSRITRGKIQLTHEVLDVADVVDKALELAHPVLEKRLRPVAVQLPDDPVHVNGDAVRLAQVLSNLLANAAKFTPADGDIAVCACRDGEHVDIAVQDSGRGIEPHAPAERLRPVRAGRAADRSAVGRTGPWASPSSRRWCTCMAARSRHTAMVRSAAHASWCGCRTAPPPLRRMERRPSRGPRRADVAACWSSTTTSTPPIRWPCCSKRPATTCAPPSTGRVRCARSTRSRRTSRSSISACRRWTATSLRAAFAPSRALRGRDWLR